MSKPHPFAEVPHQTYDLSVHRTRIKICGITRPEDAAAACDAGADAIGMIFHPSSRRSISLERARQIAGTVGPFVTKVGVFVDATPQMIVKSAREAGLALVQLHGREELQVAAQLSSEGLRIVKALRVNASLQRELVRWREAAAYLAGILLETDSTPEHGGSGIANDWDAIVRYRASGDFDGIAPLILAGGLTAENVGDVITRIRPWAVDVSSGVESEVGKKSAEKIHAFIAGVRSADRERSDGA